MTRRVTIVTLDEVLISFISLLNMSPGLLDLQYVRLVCFWVILFLLMHLVTTKMGQQERVIA